MLVLGARQRPVWYAGMLAALVTGAVVVAVGGAGIAAVSAAGCAEHVALLG